MNQAPLVSSEFTLHQYLGTLGCRAIFTHTGATVVRYPTVTFILSHSYLSFAYIISAAIIVNHRAYRCH